MTLKAKVGTIRSSDYELYRADPRMYLLRVRLGLTIKGVREGALLDGTMLHAYMESRADPEIMQGIVNKMIREHPDDREKIVSSGHHAWAWGEAAFNTSMGRKYGTPNEFFGKFRVLADELVMSSPFTFIGLENRPIPKVIRVDRLLYDEKTNKVWILDLKSTSSPTPIRMATCPFEFQTRLYTDVGRECMPEIIKAFCLPEDAEFGGMYHLVVQKPSIKFSRNDRPYKEIEKTITRGPRKGAIDIVKEYEGEPSWEIYEQRCRDWYNADGDFAGNAPLFETAPPVALSCTPVEAVDVLKDGYHEQVCDIADACIATPEARLFPPTCNKVREFRSLSPMIDFYLTPERAWEAVAQDNEFVQEWRDSDLDLNLEGPTIYMETASNVKRTEAVG